jgi:phosphomevalonate kinase
MLLVFSGPGYLLVLGFVLPMKYNMLMMQNNATRNVLLKKIWMKLQN